MSKLPWYLRRSPAIFGMIGVIKFGEAFFVAVGALTWSRSHYSSTDAGFILTAKVFDSAIYAFGWIASAIIAKLLLKVFDRVDQLHA